MSKLSIADLEKLREETRDKMRLRESGGYRGKITVHMGTCGIAAGVREVMSALLDDIEKKKVEDIIVTTSGCAGLCSREPMVTVEFFDKAPVKYVDLTPEKIKRVLEEHIIKGKVVEEFALAVGSERVG